MGLTLGASSFGYQGGGGNGGGGSQTLEQTLQIGNQIGTESINFGGNAKISANGTNAQIIADGNIAGDSYVNSINVADDLTNGIDLVSFSLINDFTRTSQFKLFPANSYEAHASEDFFGTIDESSAISKTSIQTKELISNNLTEDAYLRILGVDGAESVNGSLNKVYNNITQQISSIIQDKTSIVHKVEDIVGGDTTEITQTPLIMTVSGNSLSFSGIQYVSDYSANYTNRSLVDKEYVDINFSIPILITNATNLYLLQNT
jgi:hypothetical protein